ncbi:hypothetical protein AG1IA_08104 [Rhizoctonia solani AG-1 IA]|uniref:Uncharacterized protein n=1 Tax=Thanatephorus cucumeris (strain AG1-IA) TaxID=983506 RepID=L8WNE4_THACA|nr:hypothetical protein AG1IA_08104 [Rhizoctonia solani AG-1 IA]
MLELCWSYSSFALMFCIFDAIISGENTNGFFPETIVSGKKLQKFWNKVYR